MTLRFFYTTLLSFLIFTAVAQDDQSVNQYRNNISLEAGGIGLFGSLNYERMLLPDNALSVRLGIGLYSENRAYTTIPISIQYLFDLKRDNFLEVGFGATWADSSGDSIFGDAQLSRNEAFWNYFGSIVYRKHFKEKYLWKVGFTPVITNEFDVTMPWAVLGIGRRF